MVEIERRARAYGLPPVRWPDPWPDDYLTAMRVATYAFAAGRGHEFAMQAYRDAATEAAYDLGVFVVPTIAIGAELFWGDDRLEDAAVRLQEVTA